MSRHVSVRLFTFDNDPPRRFSTHYQIWVGGLVRGKGLYVIRPEDDEYDHMMRMSLKEVDGFNDSQVEDIMNYIYKHL